MAYSCNFNEYFLCPNFLAIFYRNFVKIVKERRFIDLALLKQYCLFSLALQTIHFVYFILLNQIYVGDFFSVVMLLFTLLWGLLLLLSEVVRRHTSEAKFVELTEVFRIRFPLCN